MTDVAVVRWQYLTRRVLLLGACYTAAIGVEFAAYLAGQPSVALLVGVPAVVLVILWSRSYARWRLDRAALRARAGQVEQGWTAVVERVGVVGLIVAWLVVLPLAAFGPVPRAVVIVLTAARIVLCVLLLAAIRVSRDRIRAAGRLLPPSRAPRPGPGWSGLTTGDLVAVVFEKLFPDRSTPAPAPAPPPTRIDGRVADAAFWDEVLDLVALTGGPLPVLESWGATHRRWRLLPKGTTASVAAAGLMPGAVVTAYPQPPSPASDESFRRHADLLRAGPAVGLLEEEGSDLLRFDRLRTEDDLTSWHRRATAARRCGVYPAEGVLTGTVVGVIPAREG